MGGFEQTNDILEIIYLGREKMKKIISRNLAGSILLIGFGLLVLFHLLVLIKIIPSNIIWGGQITKDNFNILETISLILAIIFIFIIFAKLRYVKKGILQILISIGVWVIFLYLVLNAIGNLASNISAETIIFTPVSIILAFGALRMAIE